MIGFTLWCLTMAEPEEHQFFHGFTGIDAARKLANAWVAMSADWGGQILLTCPVSQALCTDDALLQLFHDLISILWGNGELDDGTVASGEYSEGENLYIFTAPPGHGIPGGMGGGANRSAPWIHGELVDMGLEEAILAVLSGSIKRLPEVRPAP